MASEIPAASASSASKSKSTDTPKAGSGPASDTTTDKTNIQLQAEIDKQLELQHYLGQLLVLNKKEISDIKNSTDNKVELLLKILYWLAEEEEEQIQRVLGDIKEEVGKEIKAVTSAKGGGTSDESGPKKTDPGASASEIPAVVNGGEHSKAPPVTVQRSSSTVGRLINYFTGSEKGKGQPEEHGHGTKSDAGGEGGEAEPDGEGEGSDFSRDNGGSKWIPAYTLMALILKELERFNCGFEKQAKTLHSTEATLAALLEEQKKSNALSKGRYHLAQDKLVVEKEKVVLMKQMVRAFSGASGGGGYLRGAPGAGAGAGGKSAHGDGGAVGPCFSL